MSNAVVGAVYQEVLERVIEASQNDFEESGVEQATLNDLRTSWQKKLSELKVAEFPWDPKPQPTPTPAPAPANTLPSNIKPEPSPTSATGPSANNAQLPNGGNYAAGGNGQRVKTEGAGAGYDNRAYPPSGPPSAGQSYPQGMNNQAAMQRATQQLQAQFGNQAEASIAAGLGQTGLPMPSQQRSGGLQLPGQANVGGQQQRPQQYSQSQGQGQQQHRNSLQNSQLDGGADEAWETALAERVTQGSTGREIAERALREELDEMAARLQRGLMMPLVERPKKRSRKSRARKSASEKAPAAADAVAPTTTTATIPQLDGEYDDEDENDEDAINSDLDDSEDENAAGVGDEEALGEVMLCTYDKVQRVKNKWKCTLKDGVLSTQRKEYVFHKAQGEFEW